MWVVEQDFHGTFRVNVAIYIYIFFSPFAPVFFTELCSFWYGLKDFFPLHKSVDKAVLDHLKLMSLQAVERTWIRTGGYGRLIGQ